MAKCTYLTATSLDGFIATEDHDLDWLLRLDGGDGDGENPYDEFIETVGAVALGASTYEWVLAHEETGWQMPQPAWVFTHRDLPVPEAGGVTLTSGDVAEVHAAMTEAAGGKDLWVIGGGDLAGQFLDRGLLDEIWVSIAPVLLGRGAPLLPRRRTEAMRVVDVRHGEGSPFVHVRYAVR